MFDWLRELPRNLVMTLVAGALLFVSYLGVLAFWSGFGLPLPIYDTIPGDCFAPGFGSSRCVAFDPPAFILDYLFWVGVSFVVITFIRSVMTRKRKATSGQTSPDGSGNGRFADLPDTTTMAPRSQEKHGTLSTRDVSASPY